jgi:hypothetical protein
MKTFDFDNTLTITEFDEDLGMVFKEDRLSVLEILKESLPNAAIVTSRHDTLKNREEIAAFLVRNEITECDIHFTNGAPKASIVQALGSQIHFDDDSAELITFGNGTVCLFDEWRENLNCWGVLKVWVR